MSPESQRIAIAEACGWIHVGHDWVIADKIHTSPSTDLIGISPAVQSLEHGKDSSKDFNYWILPDYLNDLNAMRLAEMRLKSENENAFYRYCLMLQELGCSNDEGVCADAVTRAETFLKVTENWKDSPC